MPLQKMIRSTIYREKWRRFNGEELAKSTFVVASR